MIVSQIGTLGTELLPWIFQNCSISPCWYSSNTFLKANFITMFTATRYWI